MPKTFIPLSAWSPDFGEFSPPNPGFLCVENIAPSVGGYDRQYTFAPDSTKNPVRDFKDSLSAFIPGPSRIFCFSEPDNDPLLGNGRRVEYIFVAATDSVGPNIYMSKDDAATYDNVTDGASSNWFQLDTTIGGDTSFTRFGPFVLATNRNALIHIFDTRNWTAAGTEDFVPITLPSGVPDFSADLIEAHKQNVFAAGIFFQSSFEGYNGDVGDILLNTDDYSAENFGSAELTPHLAGANYLLIRDNHGDITALCSNDEVLYVFKEDAVYVVDGPPYAYRMIASGIGTIYKNTVFAVHGSVYFWSKQYGPARITGSEIEILGKSGWGRLVCGHDTFVPNSRVAQFPRIEVYEDTNYAYSNVPCGAYEPKTSNVVFGFNSVLRNMTTQSSTDYAGAREIQFPKRSGLASTVNDIYKSVCDCVIVVNTDSGLASVSYPMNMHLATASDYRDVYGFRSLYSRPKYNSIVCAFRNLNTYDDATDYDEWQIGSLTSDDQHLSNSIWINHFQATQYNRLVLSTGFLSAPDLGGATRPWIIKKIRPVFQPQGEFEHIFRDPSSSSGLGYLAARIDVFNKAFPAADAKSVQSDGITPDQWFMVNNDYASNYKQISFEVYRSTAFNSATLHVPWLGKFVGFDVVYALGQEDSI